MYSCHNRLFSNVLSQAYEIVAKHKHQRHVQWPLQKKNFAKRTENPNGPWGEYNPRSEERHVVSWVTQAKASDEQCCMLDSGANVLVTHGNQECRVRKANCTLVGHNETGCSDT